MEDPFYGNGAGAQYSFEFEKNSDKAYPRKRPAFEYEWKRVSDKIETLRLLRYHRNRRVS